jgi:hypothetical protein
MLLINALMFFCFLPVDRWVLLRTEFLAPVTASMILEIEMDYVIDLDPTHLALRLTVAGNFTDEACMDSYRTLACIASQGGPYTGIADLTHVLHSPVSSETIRIIAALDPAIPGPRPRVIVAATPVMYGLARMFQLHRDSLGGRLHVVQSLANAYEITGVRPEDFSKRLFAKGESRRGNAGR